MAIKTIRKLGYRGIHHWINRIAGKASYCEHDKSHKSTRYHWANISGEYKQERSDWRQLCPSCNARMHYYGSLTHCNLGHELKNENLYIYPNGIKKCRLCRNIKQNARRALDRKFHDAQ